MNSAEGSLLLSSLAKTPSNSGENETIIPKQKHSLINRISRLSQMPNGQSCSIDGMTFCDSLLHHEVATLNSISINIRLTHGKSLFEESDPADFVHIVNDGVVRLSRTLSDGRRTVIAFALPGDFIGLLQEEEHSCSASALGPVSTCRIPRNSFAAYVDSKPHFLRRLNFHLANDLKLARDQMILLGRRNAREKTAAFILTMRDRWIRVNGQSIYVALPMTRSDIGDFLGITIETVSRMLWTFAREKLIVIVPDGIRILDLHGLMEIAKP